MCRFLSFVQTADGAIYHLHPDLVVAAAGFEVHGKKPTPGVSADGHGEICKAHELDGGGICYEVVFGPNVGLRVDAIAVSEIDTARLIGIAQLWLASQSWLEEKDLHGANLRDAVLWDAVLRSADLRYANLTGADLRDANLRDANLRAAYLRCADLRDANLGGISWNSYTVWPEDFEPPDGD